MSHLPSSRYIPGPEGTAAYTYAVQMARVMKARDKWQKALGRTRVRLKARRLVKISHASRRQQWG
jgi:hypothetical protein